MGEKRDYFFTPREYLKYGDRLIEAPPLINTSLEELAEYGWYLSVYAQWLPTYAHTKIKYHFSDPDKNGYPFITFRLWHPGRVIPVTFGGATELHQKSYEFIKILMEKDLKPNFTRPPAFTLPGLTKIVTEPVAVFEKKEERQLSELEFLQEMNEKRKLALKNKSSRFSSPEAEQAAWMVANM